MVPNGGRVYYTRRSQPPLLTQMIALVYNATGDRAFLTQVLPSAKTEWEFWMRERVVMVNGEHLNKYFTDSDGPRPESYKEDLNTVSTLPQGSFIARAFSYVCISISFERTNRVHIGLCQYVGKKKCIDC